MSTKIFVFLAVCAGLIIGVLLSLQSHFEYIRTEPDVLVVARDSQMSLLFIGDIMLGRHVEDLMSQYGSDYPFTYIDGLLAEPNAVVANLEGPVMTQSVHTPSGSFHFSFLASTPKILAEHHIGIVTLANNHTFDFGSAGYNETVSLLDAGGIAHFGHPFAFSDAYVLRKQIQGRKFIFVGFNATNPNFDTQGAQQFIATLPKHDETLIVVVHGGTEYELHSSSYQQQLYRGFIDSGADLVIAHHPHVVEEIEQYKNKLIFYSLGNFIFDQYFSKDVQEMLSVKVTFSDAMTRFQLIPLKSSRSQPQLMSVPEKNMFLSELAKRSDPNLTQAIEKGELNISH